MVNFQNRSGPGLGSNASRCAKTEPQIVPHLLSKLSRRNAIREVRRDGSEDVPSMKGPAHRLAEVAGGRDLPDLVRRNRVVKHRQYAVVGRHEMVPARLDENRPPRTAHPGINHDQVNRSRRKTRPRLRQRERRLGDRIGRDFVRNIDQLRVRDRCRA